MLVLTLLFGRKLGNFMDKFFYFDLMPPLSFKHFPKSPKLYSVHVPAELNTLWCTFVHITHVLHVQDKVLKFILTNKGFALLN